jgi:hypothetical protein
VNHMRQRVPENEAALQQAMAKVLLDYGATKEGLERDARESLQVAGAPLHTDPNYRGSTST